MGQRKHKAKMGRPPKPKSEKQGSRVMVSMNEAERLQLNAEAKAAGLSLSAYLLKCWHEKGGR